MNLKDLKREIPYKWRVQSSDEYKKTADCVAYIDSRDAEDLLDDVVGELNWKDEYHRDSKGMLICRLSIYDENKKDWVYKEDCGTSGNFEKEKSEYSDAFKRVCVKYGIGRFLYRKDIQKVHAKIYTNKKGKKVTLALDKKGNVLIGNKLTEYIEHCLNNNEPLMDSKLQAIKEDTSHTKHTNSTTNSNINYLSGADTFKLKEDIKKLGGKFDPKVKKWYIPSDKVENVKKWNSNIVIEGYTGTNDKKNDIENIKFDNSQYYEKEICKFLSKGTEQKEKYSDLPANLQKKAFAWLNVLSNIDNPENREKIFTAQMDLAQFIVDHQDINTLYKTASHFLKAEGFNNLYEVDNIFTINKIKDELKEEYNLND